MINVNNAVEPSTPLARRFWILNLLLLLLYLWTLTETATISITVRPDACVAHTPERSLTIPCSGLYSGSLGLYSGIDNTPDILEGGPLEWLAPASAWSAVSVHDAGGRLDWRANFLGPLQNWQVIRGVWRTRLGELRPPSGAAAIIQRGVLPSAQASFQVSARLHRPYESAGVILLQANEQNGSEAGWVFIVTASQRRGTWWRWEDGQLSEPIAGIPFQKSALAQFQSLLRRILNAHQAALMLLFAGWLLRGALRRFMPRFPDRMAARWQTIGFRNNRLLLVLLILLVFGATLSIASEVLQRIPHVQDSVTYLFQAKLLARGAFSAPAPPAPEAFEQEFLLVRDGRWFGKYPPGYPALLAIGVRLGAPWLVNPLLAALTAPLLFVLARRLYPPSPAIAVLAATLPLVSPFFLFMSGSHLAHSAELFWMALMMVLWLHTLQKPDARLATIGAGIAFGMLFLTRQLSAVGAALPFLLGTLFLLRRRARVVRTATLIRRVLPAAAVALPFLLLLLAHQWALTGDPLQDPRLLFWEYDSLGFGRDIGEGQNAFELAMTPDGLAQIWYYDASQPRRGHSPARGLYNTQQHWLALERDLFGWLPTLTFSLLWLGFLLPSPTREDWSLLFLFLALLCAYVFYWADGISYGPRYFFVALPALYLLTARGVQRLARWLGEPGGTVAVALLLALFIAGAMVISMPQYVKEFRSYNFVSRDRLTLVERATEKPALVFVDSEADWWHYGELFSANSPWLDSPIVVARDLGPAANRRLLDEFAGRHAYILAGDELSPVMTRP